MILWLATAWASPWGDHRAGYEPLDLGAPPSSADCGACHVREYAEWSRSRHRAAWTNERMQQAYLHETRPFCVHCHAPLPRQQAEIAANLAWYLAEAPRRAVKAPEPAAAEGIGCAVCHWRDGAVLTARSPEHDGAPHPLRVDPTLAEPRFCGHCHDFAVPRLDADGVRPSEVPMQATTAEWRAWRAERADAETCQDCHMPRGTHGFVGASAPGWVRRALSVEARRKADAVVVTLTARHIGHALPTGDIFRQIVLEVDRDGRWTEEARFGRALGPVLDGTTGLHHMVVVRDTTLRPETPQTVHLTTPHALRWRVRYLYTSEPALIDVLDPRDASFVVARGRVDAQR